MDRLRLTGDGIAVPPAGKPPLPHPRALEARGLFAPGRDKTEPWFFPETPKRRSGPFLEFPGHLPITPKSPKQSPIPFRGHPAGTPERNVWKRAAQRNRRRTPSAGMFWFVGRRGSQPHRAESIGTICFFRDMTRGKKASWSFTSTLKAWRKVSSPPRHRILEPSISTSVSIRTIML